jgi:large subunit ribosomal protein L29
MNAKELREKSAEQLKKDLQDLHKKFVLLRIEAKAGQLKNIRELRVVRKSIALVKTILKEQELTSKK